MSFTWASHIAASMLMGRYSLLSQYNVHDYMDINIHRYMKIADTLRRAGRDLEMFGNDVLSI